MKRFFFISKSGGLLLMMLLIFLASGCATYQGENTDNSGYNGSYNLNDLNTYGQWIYLNPYGEVWQPYVVTDWMPFENGHWLYTSDEWTWISYEPFGWIVYHYGNWYDDPFYGWVWIPSDSPWSPARVEWFNYGDFVGWAPLPPPGVSYGQPWEEPDGQYWDVVRQQNFTRDDVRSYMIRHPLRYDMGGRGILNAPPGRSEIERATGDRIKQVPIQHERVQLPPPEIERMKLPPAESKRVEKKETEIRRRALVPREEYHRQHPERRQVTENKRSSEKEREKK